jgi:5-methylcytosine-specific restriction endonuclease McrA
VSTILALDVSGTPRQWVSHDTAISYHATNSVAWALGDVIARYRGGIQRDGTHSYIESTSIIAIRGHGFNPHKHASVARTNRTLFGRDRYMCSVCGTVHSDHKNLSRDHIIPKSRGGENTWMNVITMCSSCNGYKGNRTLEESGLQLLYAPYIPVHHEHMILQNRNILGCQMDYLIQGVPRYSRILLN